VNKSFKKSIKHTGKIIDSWIPFKIQYSQIPGFSIGIIHNGKLVYQGGFGYADIESKTPINPKTCFRISSISKTFTSVAIMQLVEQGKINLDDKLEKHLPWFKARKKGIDSKNITIRQILSHSGGVFMDSDTPHWEDDRFPDVEGLKKSISNNTIVFKSLTRFKYSNFGFALLGEIINKASSLDYKDYVTKHTIEKLGMEHTAPDFEEKYKNWLAKGYSRMIPGSEREAFLHSKTNAYAPAAGFLSNVSDLAKYLAALSFKKKEANNLLSSNSKKEIIKKYWDTGDEKKSYGLGFEIYEIGKRKIMGHGGGFAGFTTQISLDAENDIGVITLSNSNDNPCSSINIGIFETIYEFIDKQNQYDKGKKIINQEKFEGIYRSRWGDKIIVGIDNNLIAFDPKTNSPIKHGALLRPTGNNKFLIEAKSNFSYQGEFATFVFEKKHKKASKLVFGATPSERLKE